MEMTLNSAAVAAGKTAHSLKEREHLNGFLIEPYVLFSL